MGDLYHWLTAGLGYVDPYISQLVADNPADVINNLETNDTLRHLKNQWPCSHLGHMYM